MPEQVQKERQQPRKPVPAAPTPDTHREQIARARRAGERRVRTGKENER